MTSKIIAIIVCQVIVCIGIIGVSTENTTDIPGGPGGRNNSSNNNTFEGDDGLARLNLITSDPAQVSDSDYIELNEESFKILLNSSKQFKSVTELQEDLENWVAPADLIQNYPYYLSGHDDEDRPIWIAELGRWNVRKIVEEGGESMRTFDKYLRQAFYRAVKSLRTKASEDDLATQLIFIGDFDQLSLLQMAHVPTMSYMLRVTREVEPLLRIHTHAGYIVNANYLTETLVNLIRPILGAIFDKLEVYGTNSAKWIPKLLRRLPKNQIPQWYGGSKDFKPVAIYG